MSGGAAAPPRTLVEVFIATVAAHPERVALDDGARRLSYEQLDSEARHLAANLRAAGIGRRDRVGVRVPDGTAELYVAILGTLFAGAAYVPIDVSDSDERAAEILSAAGAVALVGNGLGVTLFGTGSDAAGEVEPSDDCWVIFTSGSTGRPKGVAVTHRSAAAFVDAESTLWQVFPDDRVLAALSVGFDASCEEMWLARLSISSESIRWRLDGPPEIGAPLRAVAQILATSSRNPNGLTT
jgi:non-ribosomal peptide synthetase component F